MTKDALKITAATIGALLLVVAVVIGGWKLHWWLYSANLNHQYQGNVNSQEYQAGIVSQLRDDVTAWGQTHASDPTQAADIATQFCTMYADLTNTPADLVAAHAMICQP